MFICICEGITEKQIMGAIANGANSVRELQATLGVASQCGQCGRCAHKLIKQQHGTQQTASPYPCGATKKCRRSASACTSSAPLTAKSLSINH